MPLSQLEKEEGGDKAWEKAEPLFKELGDWLRANGGPFLLGKTGKFAFLFNFRHSCTPGDGIGGHDGD